MMSRSISSIKYLSAEELFNWIKQGHSSLHKDLFQVIDVRGSDYIGGHIINCWNYPYKRLSHDEEYMNQLVDQLEKSRGANDVMNVVFHCAQSQQRGPSAAMKLLRWLDDEQLQHYQISILRGGFNYWQDIYGSDSTVTEDYKPDLWSW
ncbi:hypothetical protein Kpol_1050p35 [Vanderwaltozyma polyspora DSM 70294]|uniref:Rhodanese domain-containing protein n=1 Tax=Vanderwaltozyma polyspora (strain ATCC 22028 / DSM 70294 / BCRC 21397 / CBS 2163 / NBRC 10782 / NRRL Y-8283 / UCD 57-17) TaxID=436907 RepID=A7TET2_VANPO|nr:uncharacterized protein Kpol_1050p35 [Vanderwaltozyma polyspora DSM 70294]EDO19178.1 hypothetical protein Kpol_1050p35 [Vanderwaltozyma polyspora DSM 70294]